MGFDYQTLDELYKPLFEYIKDDPTRPYRIFQNHISYFDKELDKKQTIKNTSFTKIWANDFIFQLQELYHFNTSIEDAAFYLPSYGLLYPSIYLHDVSKTDLFTTSPICNRNLLTPHLFENNSEWGLSPGIDIGGIEALLFRLKQLESYSFYGEQTYPDKLQDAACEATQIAYKLLWKTAGWSIPFISGHDENRNFNSLSIDEKRHLIICTLTPFTECYLGKEATPYQSSIQELITAFNKARNGELPNILRPTQKYRKKQEDILEHYFSKIMQSMFVLHLTGIEESTIRKTVLRALEITPKNFNAFQSRVEKNISTETLFFNKHHGGPIGSRQKLDALKLPKEKISADTLPLWISSICEYYSSTQKAEYEAIDKQDTTLHFLSFEEILEQEILEIRLKTENLFNWCIRWNTSKNSTEILESASNTNKEIREHFKRGTWTEDKKKK